MMTKKEKRKKEKVKKKEKNDQTKDSENDNTDTVESKTNNSRSRSRGRRSLSSLFRRPHGRTESGERTSFLTQDDISSMAVRHADPRTDPRGHLQRMTVREALARNRGRSPNRRTKKLERQVLDSESNMSGDSLSISLPHLPDHFSEDQSEAPLAMPELFESRSGSTMPRVKKKRIKSEGRGAERFKQSDYQDTNIPSAQDKPVHILPLDKRKYMINKEDKYNGNTSLDSLDKSSAHEASNQTHSNSNEHKVSNESGKGRRESLNLFLSLREKKPDHVLSPVILQHQHGGFDYTNSILPPKIDIINSTPPSTEFHSMEKLSQKGLNQSEIEFEYPIKENNDANNTFEKNSVDDPFLIHNDSRKTSIPIDEEMQSKPDKLCRRSTYVSPRRFSRSSRTSVTSNKSVLSDSSNHSLPREKTCSQQSAESDKVHVKYRRHFSREKRKKETPDNETDTQNIKENQMVDASTSMGEISSASKTEETMDILDTPENRNEESTFFANESHTVSDKIIEDGDDIILISKDENTVDSATVEAEICPETKSSTSNAFPLKREVKLVGEMNSIDNDQSHARESVFRPIQPDELLDLSEEYEKEENVNVHKKQHLDLDTDEIEVISSDLVPTSEQHQPETINVLELKNDKDNLEEKEKVKEIQTDKIDKHNKKFWSGKSKKDKRKSKKKKEKPRKGSAISIKSAEKESVETVNEHNTTGLGVNDVLDEMEKDCLKSRSNSCKNKKRKSILKWRSKDKQSKSTHAKTMKRTASLSKCLDKRESLIVEERRKSTSVLDKRSRSMEDLSNKRDKQETSIIPKNVKKATPTSQSKENKSIEPRDVKPQPKLSIAAIVTLRARITRMKKAKQQQRRESNKDDKNVDSSQLGEEISHTDDNSKETDENADMRVAKVFYENEINTSIGKSENSVSIIEDADQEVKDLVYDKRIQFSPYCDDTISEEEMIKQRQRNTRLTSRRESKVRQRQKKVIDCCKKGIAFLFSHIGLCSLVVGYCILGGIVFKELEGDNEIKQKKEIKELRQNFTERIYRFAFETTLTKGSRDVFIKEVNDILKDFSVMIHKQTKEAGWDGKEIKTIMNEHEEQVEPEPEQWSYPSSLLYAITVMTTIGYGHVAPKTDEGRIMTIAYAVLGIPLTLLCLTNIGDLMAHGFRSLYGKVCCGLCCILFRPRRQRRLDPERGLTGAEERMLMQENEKSGELIHVPTSVCLLLMSSYIMLGTVLFAQWEGWDVVTGTYFCFITLSTIGFGDVVPGMSQSDWNQQEKLVSCALYLVFGLSLIAMCFNLVQEDVKAKCKWLGMKLGIIDKPVSSV